MTTEAKSAFGTTLKKGVTAIAELTNIGGPSLSAATIDATSHDSADGYREFLQGLRDGGEISIEGNFIPGNAGQVAIVTDLNDGSLDEYTITFPAVMATTWTFDAIVTAFESSSPFDDKASFTATLKVSGKPVLGVTYATGPTDIVVTGDISGALTEVPTYAAGVYTYTIDGSADNTVTVTVTAAGADEITVNGSAVESGVPSSAISLTSGEITTLTIVVKEDNKVSKTYTIYVSDGL